MLAMSLADFCHKELKEWRSAMELFMQELQGYNQRLNDVAGKNNKDVVLKQVEHFQNQFIVQKDNIQTMQHEIKIQEQNIAEDVRRDKILDETDIIGNQSFLREKVHTTEKIFVALKHDFYSFLARSL
ncbi:MAG: hypothetical protein U0T56_07960 [Ferruginibacter sp.]